MPCTDAGIAVLSGEQYVVSMKGSKGSTLACAHASTTYAMWRIKSKTQMVQTVLQVYESNFTKPRLTQTCQNSKSVMNYCGTYVIFKMRGECAEPHAHCVSKVDTIVFTTEKHQNRAIVFRTRIRTVYWKEFHINLKIEADALNRSRYPFSLRRILRYIYLG